MKYIIVDEASDVPKNVWEKFATRLKVKVRQYREDREREARVIHLIRHGLDEYIK